MRFAGGETRCAVKRRAALAGALLLLFAATFPAPREAAAQTSPPAKPPAPPPAPTAPSPTPAPPPPNVWLPKPAADLVALDKVTARTTPITLRVGGPPAKFGSLTIVLRACDVRPPDQPADAAAFLDITDSHPGGPSFHGWMVVSDPAASMLEHPIYDVRLAACHD